MVLPLGGSLVAEISAILSYRNPFGYFQSNFVAPDITYSGEDNVRIIIFGGEDGMRFYNDLYAVDMGNGLQSANQLQEHYFNHKRKSSYVRRCS